MEASIIITAILGLIASVLLSAKGLQQLLFTLAGIFLMLVPAWSMEGEEIKVITSLCIMVATGYFAGLLGKYVLVPALAAVLLPVVLLSGSQSFYLGFELHWNLNLLILPALGAFIPLSGQLKALVLAKWLEIKGEKVEAAVGSLVAALVVLFATFKAQYFGVFLVGAGWLTVVLAQRRQESIAGPFGLFAIGLAFLLMKQNNAVDDSFLRGNFLMGLIGGAAALNAAVLFTEAGRLKWVFAVLVPVIFVSTIVFLGMIHPPLGGMPAFAGVLIGGGLGAIVSRKGSIVLPLLLVMIGLAVPVQQKFAAKEEVKKTAFLDFEESAESSQPLEETGNRPAAETGNLAGETPSVVDNAGIWKAGAKGSSVLFELGPEGSVTKGAITAFDVTLEIGNDGKPTKLDVQLPINKVTTFDDTRDEHIMAEDFLNESAFPKAQFQSTSFVEQGNGYLVKGNFTMMGKKKPMTLKVRLVKSGAGKSGLHMAGATQFDRTAHGMESDPSIGDLVTVSWELEFRKP